MKIDLLHRSWPILTLLDSCTGFFTFLFFFTRAMLAASPFPTSCDHVLHTTCRASSIPPCRQEATAAMLAASPLLASCGNALQVARRKSLSLARRTSQLRRWLHYFSPPTAAMRFEQLAAHSNLLFVAVSSSSSSNPRSECRA